MLPCFALANTLLVLAHLPLVTQAFQVFVHPLCQYETPSEPFFKNIEDLTELLHGSTVATGTCVFNPSVTQLQGELYLWAARAYKPRSERFGCLQDYQTPRPPLTYDGWKGTNLLVLAVTRTVLSAAGGLKHELLGHAEVDIPVEDPRLFQDAQGKPWVIFHFPRGGCMTVSSVNVTCNANAICNVSLTGTRILWYTNMMKIEKNWVPHNGSTRMSYPVYPTFTPHSVFDWGSYEHPPVKTAFDSVAPKEGFFADMVKTYHGLVEFAGSTPAVLHDDGASYVAVGHLRAHALCFHDLVNGSVSGTCADLASKGGRHDLKFFEYRHRDGRMYSHHYKEYAMFFYRFSATPPYTITHMSHAFVPCTIHHSGITFPAGLTRVGPSRDFLISFGEANRYSRIMTVSAANFERLLVPMEAMREAVTLYSLCSLRCWNTTG